MPRISDDFELTGALRDLRNGFPEAASLDSEAEVRSAFRKWRRQTRWRQGARLAVAACLLGFCGWLALRAKLPVVPAAMSSTPDFTQLPYAQSDVPLEDAVIVHVEIQRAQLESFGLRVPPSQTGNKFPADLLVGQDGLPRAVRLSK